jgi:hypothetical protein
MVQRPNALFNEPITALWLTDHYIFDLAKKSGYLLAVQHGKRNNE